MAMFEVQWTGKWPNLCSGEWIIYKDGTNVSSAIPDELQHDEMNTAGTYSQWYFDKDWQVIWESYENGLLVNEWIAANPWINAICDTEDEKIELFNEISVSDWRHGSCGGCI